MTRRPSVASRGGPDRDGRALRHPHDDQALVRREAKEREALVLEVSWLALPRVRARAKRLALDDTAGTRTKEQASPRGGRVIGRDEDQPARHAEARKARERALGKTRGKKNVVYEYCKNLGNKKLLSTSPPSSDARFPTGTVAFVFDVVSFSPAFS